MGLDTHSIKLWGQLEAGFRRKFKKTSRGHRYPTWRTEVIMLISVTTAPCGHLSGHPRTSVAYTRCHGTDVTLCHFAITTFFCRTYLVNNVRVRYKL